MVKDISKMQIIMLSNLYPYCGEPFLSTEVEFLPQGLDLDICPFFTGTNEFDEGKLSPQIHVNRYSMPSLFERVMCFFRGLKVLFSENEFRTAMCKKQPIRNIAKALKFACISEYRLLSISKRVLYRRVDFDDNNLVIYAYWMYETAYVGARLKSLFPSSTFISRCHGYDLYGERHVNGYLPFRKFILDQADLICPISENGKQYLHDCFAGKYDEKISVMRLGTIRKFEIAETQDREDCTVLVSCSNLADVKRVHLIINALKKCKSKIAWYHFGDGDLRTSLEKQAEELPENIKYEFMGYQANEDIQRFYAEHYIDAFLNVSKSEGVPVSIMEAESYGIPIIATNVGGTSEIVHDGENGVLLNSNFTDEEFLSAIDDVVKKAERYRSEALHTWETMCNAREVYPKFYEKLAKL